MDKAALTPALVSRLVAAQFPAWACLPVAPVELDGWDNTTFRLGEDMSVRLPTAARTPCRSTRSTDGCRSSPAACPLLSLSRWRKESPGAGTRGSGPFTGGEKATMRPSSESRIYASSRSSWPSFSPPFTRSIPRAVRRPESTTSFGADRWPPYDAETRKAIATLGDQIDSSAANEVWQAALGAAWHGCPVWLHGDVTAANLLVKDGRLSAVIDFGCSGVGDPACDVTIAWTLFSGESREAFRTRLPVDDATWVRGRGWALWKALITLVAKSKPEDAATARQIIEALLAEHGNAA